MLTLLPFKAETDNEQQHPGRRYALLGDQAQVALARRTVTPRTMRACYSHFKSSAPQSVLIPKDKPFPFI